MQIDIDQLRSWIGREQEASELVTPALIERFRATLDLDGSTGPGAIAPLLIHLCLAQPAVPSAGLGADGHPARGGFLPPVPLPRRMWAGGAFTFTGDIRIGETVMRRSRIEDVALRQGRSGTLCFVTVLHHIMSDGRDVLTERQDIVYREAQSEVKAVAPPPPALEGTHRRTVLPSTILLFRYSAMTFNSHRIHYDLDWAREAEGYPGLVVHGPMQATMLVHFAEALRGARPSRFSFRSLVPLFHTDEMALNAEPEGEALRLWTARPGGPVAMEARAEW